MKKYTLFILDRASNTKRTSFTISKSSETARQECEKKLKSSEILLSVFPYREDI